jgi:wobble nucleotide-excising tRNase
MSDTTLRELEIRLEALIDKVNDRFSAYEKAVEKAERVLEQYKRDSNEWRAALTDARANTMSRQEEQAELNRAAERSEGIRNSLQFQIDDLKAKTLLQAGKSSGYSATWAMIIAVIGLIAAIGMVVVMMYKK